MSVDADIVIIEDNPNDAELVSRILKRRELPGRLVFLTDGAEALDYFFPGNGVLPATEQPRVILLDLKLPKVDGIEVLRRLKTDPRTRGIPVVVLTSSTEERDLAAAYDLGANSYVTKPIEFKKFAEVIDELGVYWLRRNRLPSRM